MKRIVAIISQNDNMKQNVGKIVDILMANVCTESIVVFTKYPNSAFNMANERVTCQNVCWPSQCDNNPKIRNWINQYFKTNQFDGMLHVIEDNTDIIKDPTQFMDDIENMMKTLDYDVWFSTICDTCNYIYSKYNPRLSIVLDRAELFKLNLGKQLLYTSHSNTQWIIYNFDKISDDLLKFNENFSIAMFYIIEFLARRRNTKKENQLYFMNQYLTVQSEYGTFKSLQCDSSQDNQSNMKEEDKIFNQMEVNFSPDNNIDNILETTWKKIKEKI